jgi:translation initiation factor IF-2
MGGPRGPAEVTAPPTDPTAVRRGPHPVRGGRPTGPTGRVVGQSREERERERSQRGLQQQKAAAQPIIIDRDITITEGITVKDLSEKLGVKVRDLIKRLLEIGVLANINHNLDPGLAEKVAQSFGARTNLVSFEEDATQQIEVTTGPETLVPRAPVVTVMGHVDHGKTSLLDAIRETSVTSREHGGITQHIGAYSVEKNNRRIVFLDTPGHEAFTRMRARGSKVTDIVILVVAADDGVMPQTIEAIDHAKAAKVPIIVAINNIDRPGAIADRVKKQLGDHGLVPEDWGGQTVMVEVSAKQKTNLDLLLEMILLVADIQDLKANPERPASGTVLEARLDRGRGPVSTVLVQNGTLHVGDSILVGAVFGKIRAMINDLGDSVDEAPPSMPVEILGLQTLPQAGDQFQAVTDLTKAKQIAHYREGKLRDMNLAKSSRVTLEQLHDQLKAGTIKELPIIIKADVQGSVEVLAESLSKLGDERVKIRIIHTGVGAINISDVLLASASNSIIIGFNVRPEKKASDLAQQEEVEIRLHTIIYNVTDEMKKAMVGLLEPTHHEVVLGKAEVLQAFKVSKVGTIAGTMVTEGRVTRDAHVRLLRDNVVIFEGKIASLKRFKDDASEVRNGLECGIGIENYNDVKTGDVIEAFMVEKVAAKALA